jgi:hypothetical protein
MYACVLSRVPTYSINMGFSFRGKTNSAGVGITSCFGGFCVAARWNTVKNQDTSLKSVVKKELKVIRFTVYYLVSNFQLTEKFQVARNNLDYL